MLAVGVRVKGGGVEFWMKKRQYLMSSPRGCEDRGFSECQKWK